jgi:glycosyltransferase involved in cell wall biosynthesis
VHDRIAGKRVAILLPSLDFGGAERVALTLATSLQDSGCEVDFLVMRSQGRFLEEARSRFTVVDLACHRTWQLPIRLLSYLRKTRPHVLISSFWKLNLCSCLAKAFHRDVRLLLWEHSMASKSRNSPPLLYFPSASIAYRLSDRVICVSDGVRRDIAGMTLGLQDRLTVIFNPIAAPPALRMEARPVGDVRRIVWVGRMMRNKNPRLLLEAFALVARDSDALLTYVGDGPERGSLEARTIELGLAGRVTFTGYEADPYRWILASDLLVVSSDHEGFGNVLVEALHCGLRVVSTDCGAGVHEILEGRYGTIVPVGDRDAMAAAIREELSLEPVRSVQMEGARRFAPDVIARQFVEAMT